MAISRTRILNCSPTRGEITKFKYAPIASHYNVSAFSTSVKKKVKTYLPRPNQKNVFLLENSKNGRFA